MKDFVTNFIQRTHQSPPAQDKKRERRAGRSIVLKQRSGRTTIDEGRALAKNSREIKGMVRFEEETSNELFDELADWNALLKAEKIDLRGPTP